MNKENFYNIKIMNKGYGKTYHELQHKIKTLLKENEEKERVIKTQDYIINELEEWLKGLIDNFNEDVSPLVLHEQMTIRLIYEYLNILKNQKR